MAYSTANRSSRYSQQVEDAKQRAAYTPIDQVMRRLGFEFARTTRRDTWYSCPLHQDGTPSFHTTTGAGKDGRDVWKCFGCQEGGDVIRLVQRARRVSFMDAVRWINS